MQPTSMLAVYVLFWVISFFIVLPFGIRTEEEMGRKPERGHADSAPHRFSLGRVSLRATVVAALAFGLFYANYVNGWVTLDTVDWASPPTQSD